MVSLQSLRGLPTQIRWPAVLFILGVTLLLPARANCLSDCKDKYARTSRIARYDTVAMTSYAGASKMRGMPSRSASGAVANCGDA